MRVEQAIRECTPALQEITSSAKRTMRSPFDPNSYGDPYGARPLSIASSSSLGVESQWRRRQTIKRGKTRRVKLTKGNFITEYAVPSPVFSAIEPKWQQSNTTEFS